MTLTRYSACRQGWRGAGAAGHGGGWAARVVSVCEEREEFVVQHVAQELGMKMARVVVVEGSLGPYEGRIEYRVLSDEGLAARYL
ncbi:unnamed protein product [Closterium sp. Naga37s-1]|nr:unnamed protein product [Closterium sp. Naga37s-1]